MIDRCPACSASTLRTFHRAPNIPTNSCLLLDDPDEARGYPCGELELAFCDTCGFITNRAFDASLTEYSARYEETQGFSPHFVDFGRGLAKDWVERYGLTDGHVVEIGCGKGEFLIWMLEAGVATGVGIDPSVHPDRHDEDVDHRITWIQDFYSERYSHMLGDAVVCRHTLEHIHPVGEFMQLVRRSLGDAHETAVLFELPDVARVLEEAAFWDTYYEHCSYFSAGSLARLFNRSEFEILDIAPAFDDQYLLIEARPSAGGSARVKPHPLEDDMARLRQGVQSFADGYRGMVEHWQAELRSVAEQGGTAVIWGGGSKAVAFLSSIGADTQIRGAVDINPHKQGRYIAGTGHRVLAPRELEQLRPDLVIAMNPVYTHEIRGELDGLGLPETRLVTV